MNFFSSIFKKKEAPADSFKSLKNYEKDLFALVDKRNFDVFKQTLESEEVDINIQDHQGSTLLHHSAGDDEKLAFTKYLLDRGINFNLVDKKGFTALFHASYWNQLETVTLLVTKDKIELDTENSAFDFPLNPLTAAIYKDHYEIAKRLLYSGANPHKAIHLAKSNQKYKDLLDFYIRRSQGKDLDFERAQYLPE